MEGLAEDASRGHITARKEDGRVYIKPWGVGFEEVHAADFQEWTRMETCWQAQDVCTRS